MKRGLLALAILFALIALAVAELGIDVLNSATAASSISPGLFTNGLSLSQRFR